MKIFSIVTLFCILCTATAYASWQDVFQSIYQAEGTQQAVAKALEEGASPEAIITFFLTIEEKNNAQDLLSALYCSGADGNDIKKASNGAGIATEILVSGYEKSVAECGDAVQTTAAITPEETGLKFTGMPSPANSAIGGADSSYASPSKPKPAQQ